MNKNFLSENKSILGEFTKYGKRIDSAASKNGKDL